VERLDTLHFHFSSQPIENPAPPARMAAVWWHSKIPTYRLGASTLRPDTRAQSLAMAWMAGHATPATTFMLDELVAHAVANGEAPSQAREDIRSLLWDLLNTAALRPMACAMRAPVPGDMPAATPLARAAALLGNNTSNAFHEHVVLSESQHRLLLLLDGTRSAASVADALGEGATEETVRADIKTLADLHILC
jgi:hypothetical protein